MGDTDFIRKWKILSIYALIPVSGTYVMTAADQASKAALAMKPKLAIPMHYGAIVGSEDDAQKFKKGLEGKVEVLILKKS